MSNDTSDAVTKQIYRYGSEGFRNYGKLLLVLPVAAILWLWTKLIRAVRK